MSRGLHQATVTGARQSKARVAQPNARASFALTVEDVIHETPPGAPAWMTTVPPGYFDRRTLDQAGYWLPSHDVPWPAALTVDRGQGTERSRRPVLLVAMSTEHLVNVLAWLHERALELHFEAMVDAALGALDERAAGEVLAHEVGASLVVLSPSVWLETTALVRAIRRELRRRERCQDTHAG